MRAAGISSASGLGIAFSVLAAGLAAFNLLLDFDLIEHNEAYAAASVAVMKELGIDHAGRTRTERATLRKQR